MIQSDFPTRQPAPKIGENGTWLEWDELTQAYVDTGKPSRGEDGTGGSVFVARFGSTTSAEIEAAYQAGKVVLVPITRYHTVAQLTGRESATLHHFGAVYSSVGGTPLCAIAATCSADDWSAIEITLARQVNIATNTFSDESTYSVGDYVLYNGLLYRFTAAHTGAWAAGDAVRVRLADDVQELRAALNGKGTYSKPSDGIPKTDLAAAVQTSLGKADTALQAHQDISGKADRITEVTVSDAGAVTQALEPNKLYHFTGALTALTLTLTAPAAGQLAQYHFDFLSGATAPTLTLPGTVTMPDSFAVEANKRYEVDILGGYGAVMAWANS